MKALITGATSGLGKDIALFLNSKNIELILVGRNNEELKALERVLGCQTIKLDLSKEDNVYKLYELTKKENIDILINNAGFGLYGMFNETDLGRELEMIDVNIKCVHILTKLFLNDFVKRDSGYILNVSSSASFLAGPKMSTYYATKNYVTALSSAIYEELKKIDSKVSISILCPGPFNTNFNKTAGVSFNGEGIDSKYVAEYAIKKMFRKKLIIIPTFKMKLGIFATRLLPRKFLLKYIYNYQNSKNN